MHVDGVGVTDEASLGETLLQGGRVGIERRTVEHDRAAGGGAGDQAGDAALGIVHGGEANVGEQRTSLCLAYRDGAVEGSVPTVRQ